MAVPAGIICFLVMPGRLMLVASIMGINIVKMVMMGYDVMPDIYQDKASQ